MDEGPSTASPRWQDGKKTIVERLAFLCRNEALADVHFLVGAAEDVRERVPAHKFVLAMGSSVFDAMFNGGLAADRESTADIEVLDVELGAFYALLKFLYTDEAKIDPDNVMTTLYAAKKYAVIPLEQACVAFLKESLTEDNAFLLLDQARLFSDRELEERCLEVIDRHAEEALGADGFTDIDLATLTKVLSRDTLFVNEFQLFHAACRWARAFCRRRGMDPATPEAQREALGDAFALLRFPLMTPEEFAQGPAQSGLLSSEECTALFIYFHTNPRPPVPFPTRARRLFIGFEKSIARFTEATSNSWAYNGYADRIQFSVNSSIFISGLGLFGSYIRPFEYFVQIQILCGKSGTVLAQTETTLKTNGAGNIFKVSFDEPVAITPRRPYIASALLQGRCESYYGTGGAPEVVHQFGSPVFRFTNVDGNEANHTSVAMGQIPTIYFYLSD